MNLTRAIGLLLIAYPALILCSVLPWLLPGRLPVPDVALLVALHAGLTCRLAGGTSAVLREGGPAAIAAFGLVLGYIADLVGGSPKGFHALGLAILLLCLRSVATQLLVRGSFFIMIIAAVATFGFGLLLSVIRAWAEPETGSLALPILLGQALMTALFAPFLFRLLYRVDARFWPNRRVTGLYL